MSSSSLITQVAVLKEFFLAQDMTSALAIGASNLYLSLHSAHPGDSGDQTSNEVAYTGYARVAVPRTTAGWTVDALTGKAQNATGYSWPPCTGGTATAKYVGIGTLSSGNGSLLMYSPIVASATQWCGAQTNMRPTAGVAADWVTVAGYANGATTFANGDEVAIAQDYEEGVPDGLSINTAYFVRNATLEGAWPEAVGFQLATVSGAGVLVDLSPGDNRCRTFLITKVAALSISSGVTPTLPTLGGIIYAV